MRKDTDHKVHNMKKSVWKVLVILNLLKLSDIQAAGMFVSFCSFLLLPSAPLKLQSPSFQNQSRKEPKSEILWDEYVIKSLNQTNSVSVII